MDGLSEKIIAFFKADRFAAHSGAELLSAGPGYAQARLEIGPEQINAAGGVQGGAIFTLCDFAFAAAANADGILTVGIDASIQYFRAPRGRFLTAKAQVVSRSRKLCGCTVDVFDEDGKLAARFNGTGYRKGDKLPFADGEENPES